MQTPVYVAESGCTINVGADTVTPSGVAANDCMTFAQANAAANIPLSPGAIRTLSLYDPNKPVWAVWSALWNGSTWTKIKTLQENGILSQPGNILATFVHYPSSSPDEIEGYVLSWLATSGQCLKAGPGKIWINGNFYEDSADITDLTGDSVAGGAFTGATLSHYFVYLYDDAGTRKLEFDLGVVASGAFTNEPVWNESLRQYSHPALGDNYRFIGSFNTESDGACQDFYCVAKGNNRKFYKNGGAGNYFVSSAPKATTWVTVDFAPYAPSIIKEMLLTCFVRNNDGSPKNCILAVHRDERVPASQASATFAIQVYVNTNGWFYLSPYWFPIENTSKLHWSNTGVAGTADDSSTILACSGFSYTL